VQSLSHSAPGSAAPRSHRPTELSSCAAPRFFSVRASSSPQRRSARAPGAPPGVGIEHPPLSSPSRRSKAQRSSARTISTLAAKGVHTVDTLFVVVQSACHVVRHATAKHIGNVGRHEPRLAARVTKCDWAGPRSSYGPTPSPTAPTPSAPAPRPMSTQNCVHEAQPCAPLRRCQSLSPPGARQKVDRLQSEAVELHAAPRRAGVGSSPASSLAEVCPGR
jgi:hypothetical protein